MRATLRRPSSCVKSSTQPSMEGCRRFGKTRPFATRPMVDPHSSADLGLGVSNNIARPRTFGSVSQASSPPASWGPRFGAQLERARGRALLSRTQLAQRVGVAEETVRRWEHGNSAPSADRLARLIAVLAIDGAAFSAPDRVSEEMPPLARLLRAERLSRGATQASAAGALDVAPATYAGWESGRSSPGPAYAASLADYLGVSESHVRELTSTPFTVDFRQWPPLGQLLGERRQALRLTREELGRLVGVAPATVVAWELGYRRPRPQQLRSLAFAIHVAVVELEQTIPRSTAQLPALGQAIRHHQARLGLSLRDVADRTGVDAATLSRWIHGVNKPAVSSLSRLAEALNVPPSYLLEMSG